MARFWVLRDKQTVRVASLEEWAREFELHDRHVAITEIGACRVSTVFLGVDHSFHDEGPPLLFESMVFGGPLDQEQRRYSTWDEAEAGHAELVEQVQRAVLQ